MKSVRIYTDGSASPNPGRGGWGAILLYGDTEKLLQGSSPLATNNEMELMGPIVALEALKESCLVTLYSDSQYVVQGASEWLPSWKKNGWRRGKKKDPLLNEELWKRLDRASQRHTITWRWVKAHNGDPYNEQVDAAAKDAATRQIRMEDY